MGKIHQRILRNSDHREKPLFDGTKGESCHFEFDGDKVGDGGYGEGCSSSMCGGSGS